MDMPEGLLDAVKNRLNITWNDESTDADLSGIIARGMDYMNRIACDELDYSEEGKPRELLMEYCMYVRANALSEFQTDYLSELLSLQIQQAVTENDTE